MQHDIKLRCKQQRSSMQGSFFLYINQMKILTTFFLIKNTNNSIVYVA